MDPGYPHSGHLILIHCASVKQTIQNKKDFEIEQFRAIKSSNFFNV